MYIINKDKNRIEKIEEKTFKELGFREKEHLQEWILNNPECLGEELLIIQKEFDGFDDTYERLDLLALDKLGNLVIIENKLDYSGKDVTWQVLKYASYCSTLTKDDIINVYQSYLNKKEIGIKAEDKLKEFFDSDDYEEKIIKGNTQRIMMTSREFKKEVTSTVLWLMNFGLRIQCFQFTPYMLNDQLFLTSEQIIPMKNAEDYVIKIANKNKVEINSQEELKSRHYLRLDFWKKLLPEINKKTPFFQNINPSSSYVLGASAGISGVSIAFEIPENQVRLTMFISRSSKDENKLIFDYLYKNKDTIEKEFGYQMEWSGLENRKTAKITFYKVGFSLYNREDWEKMIYFFTDKMPKFINALSKPLKEVNKILIKSKQIKYE